MAGQGQRPRLADARWCCGMWDARCGMRDARCEMRRGVMGDGRKDGRCWDERCPDAEREWHWHWHWTRRDTRTRGLTRYRAHIGEGGRARERERKVREVGEQHEDHPVRRDQERPFSA